MPVLARRSRPPAERARLSWRKRLLFVAAGVAVVVAGLAGLLEVGARLLVPAVALRVLADVFVAHPDPDVGYTMRRSYSGRAFGADLATNSLGFRGPEWPAQKPPGGLRIALIGDSIAFGFGVPFAQTLGERLAERLRQRLARPVEVLNFGVNGYNARQQLAVLERYALPHGPDIVLLLPCNNDDDEPLWADDHGYLRFGAREQAGHGNIALDRRQRGLARFQRSALRHSRFVFWLRLQWYKVSMARAAERREAADGIAHVEGWLQPVGPGPVAEALRAPVYDTWLAMIDLCRRHGAEVAFVTYMGVDAWRATAAAAAWEASVPLLELVPLLGSTSWADTVATWSLGWDDHMGPAAHAVFAAGVEEFLVEHGLVR